MLAIAPSFCRKSTENTHKTICIGPCCWRSRRQHMCKESIRVCTHNNNIYCKCLWPARYRLFAHVVAAVHCRDTSQAVLSRSVFIHLSIMHTYQLEHESGGMHTSRSTNLARYGFHAPVFAMNKSIVGQNLWENVHIYAYWSPTPNIPPQSDTNTHTHMHCVCMTQCKPRYQSLPILLISIFQICSPRDCFPPFTNDRDRGLLHSLTNVQIWIFSLNIVLCVVRLSRFEGFGVLCVTPMFWQKTEHSQVEAIASLMMDRKFMPQVSRVEVELLTVSAWYFSTVGSKEWSCFWFLFPVMCYYINQRVWIRPGLMDGQ